MKRNAALQLTAALFSLASLWSLVCSAQTRAPTDYVNTLRGSDSTPDYSRGNTFPAVAVPFGANLWTPVTKGNSSSWLYEYTSPTLQGFAVSHEPSPWIGDYASFQVMPSTGEPRIDPRERAARFSHADEVAQAHYYSVVFSDAGIRTEFVPTLHAAVFRFTYPGSTPATLLFDSIDDGSGVMEVSTSDRSVSGHVDQRQQRIYFFATVDRAIQQVFDPEGGGVNVAVAVESSKQQYEITLRIGTSYLNVEQARNNLDHEVGASTFDDVRSAAKAQWDELLGRISIDVATDAERITFYSSLYRAFLYPNLMSESVNGQQMHYSPFSKDVRPGLLYVNNGFWDTYRAAWPLYVLLVPHRAGEMLDGFVNAYKDAGWIPRWSGPGYADVMVGTHSDIVMADAYLKGVRNFDANAAFEAMLKNALVYSGDSAQGRKGNARSIFKGYIPLEDAPESAAWHLEDCVNDFGIARMAEARGDKALASYFFARSKAYSTLFSADVGFFRGRSADGRFRTENAAFHPNEWGFEFTEGNAWHYVAAASHDPEGMIALYGGAEAFARKLEDVLLAPADFMKGSYNDVIHEMREAVDVGMGQYAHPNEPVHHLLYMFNYGHAPASTQRFVSDVLSPNRGIYGPGSGDGRGYLGDEDNGQMSAWYVFSALGFYPAAPGHEEYAIGSPTVRSASLKLENGRVFTVIAHDNAADRPYVQTALLSGRPLDRPFVRHADLVGGGTLEVWMGSTPSNWGLATDSHAATHESRLDAPLRDCARDGAVHAQGEGPERAFDDDSATTWQLAAQSGVLEYELPDGAACQAGAYTLTSGGASPERDPRSWRIEDSADGVRWTLLDQRSDETFQWRRQTRVFPLPRARASRHYRLVIISNRGATSTDVAEFELLAARPSEATARSRPAHSASSLITRLGCSCNVVSVRPRSHGLPTAVFLLCALVCWALRRRVL